MGRIGWGTDLEMMKVHPTSFGLAGENEHGSHDAFAVKAWEETVLAVLAHGTGLGGTGQAAARRTVSSLVANYQSRPRTWTPHKALVEFTRLVNRTLHLGAHARQGEPELIIGLSIAVVEGDRLYGMNVGDSRVYLARDGCLAQLSPCRAKEPTVADSLLADGLGLELECAPHLFETELRDGDVALMCSFGVANLLDEHLLAAQLQHRGAARSIVSSARELAPAKARGDMSAIVLDIEETGHLRAVKEAPLKIPATLSKGQVIDRFTLLKPFQHSDRVWLAARDGRRYTLKFAPIEARKSDELLELFIKETANATRLAESGFFPRAFVPEPATMRFYAMEFIEAPSLKALLRSRRLAVDEAVVLGKFLLVAAQYLLRFDLVHGDLKPENILIAQGYDALQFRLVDFGSMTPIFSITSRAGTASYLAPERFHGAPIAERTEIFALGVTIFEALTGSFPYGEIERFQTPSFHSSKRPSSLNPNVPPWLESVLLRALSVEPDQRYQNYSEMLFDLEHPAMVAPFHGKDAPLLERDPLRFYRTGFYLLLAVLFGLLLLLLNFHAKSPFHP
jgi:serine/threonine protein kinase